MLAALVAAPLAPARKALAPRNCCRAARRSAAVASADVPPLADAKLITLTCVPAGPSLMLLRRETRVPCGSPIWR